MMEHINDTFKKVSELRRINSEIHIDTKLSKQRKQNETKQKTEFQEQQEK